MSVASERVVVVGTSGSGKSTTARRLALKDGCAFIELDELFWGSNWQAKPTEQFLDLVRQAAAGERWVAAGNYSSARAELWSRADTVVWLNLSLPVVLSRIMSRTSRRILRREVLWHGNRESLVRTLFTRESIIWWALSTHAVRRKQLSELRESGQYPQLRWLEFTRPAQVERFLAADG